MADELTTDACSGAIPQRCIPGDFDLPACYSTDGGVTVLQGFNRITRTAECRITASVILDEALAPVLGAVLVACPGSDSGGGGGGGGGSALAIQSGGVPVSAAATCLNFTGAASATIVGACIDVNVAPGAVAFPLLAPNGSCAAPSYAFVASPDSGLFYTGTAVRLGDDNCVDFIEVGASITVHADATITIESVNQSVNLTAGLDFNATLGRNVSLDAGNVAVVQGAASVLVVSNAGSVTLGSAGLSRLTIASTGEWFIDTLAGTAGQVPTSNGPGVSPSWQTPAGGTPLLYAENTTGFAAPAAAGTLAFAIGSGASASAANTISLGTSAAAGAVDAISIGNGASNGAFSTGSVAIGAGASTSNFVSVAIGNGATALATRSIAVGQSSQALAGDATAVGEGAQATGLSAVALGSDAVASHQSSTAIGNDSTSSAQNQITLGGTSLVEVVPGVDAVQKLGSLTRYWHTFYARALNLPGTNITVASTPYPVVATDYSIFVDTSGGAVEVDLPASPENGRQVIVKKITADANVLTVDGNGKTIEGLATFSTAATTKPSFSLAYNSAANDWRIV